jgi:hypothetical protein
MVHLTNGKRHYSMYPKKRGGPCRFNRRDRADRENAFEITFI